MMRRWATEDPNPGEKIAEDKRIQEMGQKAISGMLDENLVEAAQTLRALEDGDAEDFYPIEPSAPSPEPEPVAPPSKKARNGVVKEVEAKTNGDSHQNGKAEGLFSADTMDNLRFYAEMTKKHAEEDRLKERKLPSKPAMTSLLGGYGSGDESD